MAEASLQAVIRACLADLAADRSLSPRQWQVCHPITDCRTAALGGFALECDGCGDRPFFYHAVSGGPRWSGASASARPCCRSPIITGCLPCPMSSTAGWDYRDDNRRKVMTLTGEELLRRFLLHVLLKGFMRVRHFGFLANRCRARRLADIRTALAALAPAVAEKPPAARFDGYPCPQRRTGHLRVIAHLMPTPRGGG